MNMLILLLASYGLCFGLMNDKMAVITDLAKKIPLFRDNGGQTFFERMFLCPYCTGFHTGWVVWCAVRLPDHFAAGTLDVSLVGGVLAFSFASSAFCYGADTIIQWFE
jgi:hypothetical protein